MVKYIKTVIFGSSLLLLGAGLQAQVNPDRDPYYDQMPARTTATGNVMDQVRADLDQTINNGYLRTWQRDALTEARHDLRMAERADNRDMTRHALDRAIDRMQNVASSDRLTQDQRAVLQQDVKRLRDFRESGMVYSSSHNPDYRMNGYYDRFGNWHPNR